MSHIDGLGTTDSYVTGEEAMKIRRSPHDEEPPPPEERCARSFGSFVCGHPVTAWVHQPPLDDVFKHTEFGAIRMNHPFTPAPPPPRRVPVYGWEGEVIGHKTAPPPPEEKPVQPAAPEARCGVPGCIKPIAHMDAHVTPPAPAAQREEIVLHRQNADRQWVECSCKEPYPHLEHAEYIPARLLDEAKAEGYEMGRQAGCSCEWSDVDEKARAEERERCARVLAEEFDRCVNAAEGEAPPEWFQEFYRNIAARIREGK